MGAHYLYKTDGVLWLLKQLIGLYVLGVLLFPSGGIGAKAVYAQSNPILSEEPIPEISDDFPHPDELSVDPLDATEPNPSDKPVAPPPTKPASAQPNPLVSNTLVAAPPTEPVPASSDKPVSSGEAVFETDEPVSDSSDKSAPVPLNESVPSPPSPAPADEPVPALPPSPKIESVQVEGNTVIGTDVIQKRVVPLLPHEIKGPGLTSLEIFTNAITDLYHKEGYLLAQAYIPEQEIVNGVLKMTVMEGTLGAVTVSGNTVYPTSFIASHFNETKRISYLAFERAMLIVNEYDDLKATGLFQAGATPGHTDFLVQASDDHPLHYTVDYNNYGSNLVSRHRFGVGMTLGNLLRYGSRLSVRGIVGAPVHDMAYGTIHYGIPIRFNGTRLNLRYLQGDSDLGKSLADLQITMKTRGWGISVEHPFIKTRSLNVRGEMGLEGQDSRQFFRSVNLKQTDRIRLLHLDVDYNKQVMGGHQNAARVSLRQGLGKILGGMPDNDPYASRFGADNGFLKGVIELARFQKMTDLLSLVVRGVGQVSSDALVVGEQFVLGGPDSVRGYAVGEFLGDSGYAASLEIQVSPLENKKRLQAVFFMDQGEGSLKRATEGVVKKGSLAGAGFGVRLHHDHGIKRDEKERPLSMDLMVDVGYPLKDGPHGKVGEVYYVRAALRY